MTLLPLNGWMIALVAMTALTVIVYWWRITRGSWWHWPAGRALMGLLAIIVLISGWAAVNVLFLPKGGYDGKVIAYFGLYGLMEASLILIGVTIHREMKRGKERKAKKSPAHTGPVVVVVASENNIKGGSDNGR